MIKKIKCWLFGHIWKQVGNKRIKHVETTEGIEVYSIYKDHFLFTCMRCQCFWEHECNNTYDQIGEYVEMSDSINDS